MNKDVSNFASTKPREQQGGKSAVPRTRHLLQSVERLVELAGMIRTSYVKEPRRLAAVDNLGQGTMQEGVLHMELMNRTLLRQCQVQDCANSGAC